MASLYRPTYTKTDPKTGKRVVRKVRKWYGKFRDPSGKVRCIPLCEVKTAAIAILADTIRDLWLERAGMLDPAARSLSQPIQQHLQDYHRHLDARGRSRMHIAETIRIISKVSEACRLQSLGDLQSADEQLENHLAERRRGGSSHRTVNADLVAVRAFCRWLIQRKRIKDDPTTGLQRLNEDEDPRVQRRALTDPEAARLYLTTYSSQRIIRGLSGQQRATLYLLALRTGLRRGELRGLTTGSFDLSSDSPSVTVTASQSKRRRVDILPLPGSVATSIREYISGRSTQDLIWPGSWWQMSAKMLRLDLKDSGIEAQDSQGRVVDFHALRTTFITSLARIGVAPAVAQKLARHSDVNLTMSVYTQLQMTDLAEAVSKLPMINSLAVGVLRDSPAA